MNFLNRPVFTTRPHFSSPGETLHDDATRESIGFGVPTPWRVQEHAQRLWKLKFQLLRSEAQELEDFFDARRGQAEGFWMPTFNGDLRLAAPVETNAPGFSVEPCGSPAFFSIHPGNAHVAFIDPRTGAITPKTITGATGAGSVENILFSGSAGFSCPVETEVCWLVYVRFNSDVLSLRHITDDLSEASIDFLELPVEYAQIEAGTRPVWLYEIRQGNILWRWTSHAAKVFSGGVEWEPQDITHTQITRSAEMLDEGVVLKVGLRTGNNPFRQLLSGAPSTPLGVRIYQVFFPALALGAAVYDAPVRNVGFQERGVAEATLGSLLGIGDARVPRILIQTFCNWQLFDGSTCRVSEASRRFNATVSATGPLSISSPGFNVGGANYLALGRVVFGDETRLITAHTGQQIRINAAFRADMPVGSVVSVMPGCDKRLTTCRDKYNNVANFGGFPFVPTKNPQLKALNPPNAQTGGKK